jgi:hypothetical protein
MHHVSHYDRINIGVRQVSAEAIRSIDAQLKLLARIFGGVHGLGQKNRSDPIFAYLFND